LAIVALTTIYSLVREYQTLAREIATPRIPFFVGSCLQIIKPPILGKPVRIPLSIVETVLDAFSTLIPLYSTTFRPFNSQIRAIIRPYLAPTSSEETLIPSFLQRGSRRLAITLHYTAPQGGGSDDWAKLVRGFLRDFHQTADLVFRGIDESWEPTAGFGKTTKIDFSEEQPRGGGDQPEELPHWFGVRAGIERLQGLLSLLSDSMRYQTKGAVSIPVGDFMDLVSRIASLTRRSPRQAWDQELQMQPSVLKEEKEELCSLLPDLHVSALQFLLAICRRLRRNALPLTTEALDYVVRFVNSGTNISSVRNAAYTISTSLIQLSGPSMSREAVQMVDPIIHYCCRDVLQPLGIHRPSSKPSDADTASTKKNTAAGNADSFLHVQGGSGFATRSDQAGSLEAKELLTVALSLLPQHMLKLGTRKILDVSAIFSCSKDAMIASILSPYDQTQRGMFASVMPYLTQQFPYDQSVEVLRSHFRTSGYAVGDLFDSSTFAELQEEKGVEVAVDTDESVPENSDGVETRDTERSEARNFSPRYSAPEEDLWMPRKTLGSIPVANSSNGLSEKRKNEEPEPISHSKKRQAHAMEPKVASPPAIYQLPPAQSAPMVEDEGSDDESVHLNMELEDEDEGEDDED
jgi:pre-rRNA-processing protein RIX1